MLGYSYRKLGDTDAAFENYQTALRLNRIHRGAHEYLGELHLEMGNVADAQKLLQALGKLCTYFCAGYKELREAIANYTAAHGG